MSSNFYNYILYWRTNIRSSLYLKLNNRVWFFRPYTIFNTNYFSGPEKWWRRPYDAYRTNCKCFVLKKLKEQIKNTM